MSPAGGRRDDEQTADDSALNQELRIACLSGDTDNVQRLLFAGATIPTNATDCLFAAAWNGPVAAVRLLLRAHACMNAKQQQRGRTALHLAAIAGRRSIVNELLAAGALPDIPCSLGCTALEYAQEFGCRYVAALPALRPWRSPEPHAVAAPVAVEAPAVAAASPLHTPDGPRPGAACHDEE